MKKISKNLSDKYYLKTKKIKLFDLAVVFDCQIHKELQDSKEISFLSKIIYKYIYDGSYYILHNSKFSESVSFDVLLNPNERINYLIITYSIINLNKPQIHFSLLVGNEESYSYIINSIYLALITKMDEILINVSRGTIKKYIESLFFCYDNSFRFSAFDKSSVWSSKDIVIKNKHGLHSRPAAVLCKIAKSFSNSIWIGKDKDYSKGYVNSKNYMELLSLNIECNDTIKIVSKGDNIEYLFSVIENAANEDFSSDFYVDFIKTFNK